MIYQQHFNKVWDYFITKENPKSYDSTTGYCLYRGPNGTRCAIGILIPDKLYNPGMEKSSIDSVLTNFPKLADYLESKSMEDRVFMYKLQSCHDDPITKESMKQKLVELASEYNLQITSV